MKKRGKKICFLNKKGGVAKTTTVVTIASILNSLKKKILIVDCDGQANVTKRLLSDESISSTNSLFDLINDHKKLHWSECIVKTENYSNVAVIPGSLELDDTSAILKKVNRGLPQLSLNAVLLGIEEHFDYVFFDCAPNISILNQATLVTSDNLIIPTDCTTDGLAGAELVMEVADSLKQLKSCEFSGLLLCNKGTRKTQHSKLFSEKLKEFKGKIFNPTIPSTSYIPSAGNLRKTIFDTHKHHNVSKAYQKIAAQI